MKGWSPPPGPSATSSPRRAQPTACTSAVSRTNGSLGEATVDFRTLVSRQRRWAPRVVSTRPRRGGQPDRAGAQGAVLRGGAVRSATAWPVISRCRSLATSPTNSTASSPATWSTASSRSSTPAGSLRCVLRSRHPVGGQHRACPSVLVEAAPMTNHTAFARSCGTTQRASSSSAAPTADTAVWRCPRYVLSNPAFPVSPRCARSRTLFRGNATWHSPTGDSSAISSSASSSKRTPIGSAARRLQTRRVRVRNTVSAAGKRRGRGIGVAR